MKYLKSYKIFESHDLELPIKDIFINIVDDDFLISISNLIKVGKSKNDPSLSTYGQFYSEKDKSAYEERLKSSKHVKNFICVEINAVEVNGPYEIWHRTPFQFDDIENEINHLISFLENEDYKFYQIYYRGYKKSGFDFKINKKSIKNYLPEMYQVELIFEKI